MPEGDTIYRAARTLHAALAGRTVTRFESGLAQLVRIDRAEPMAGRRIERVAAAGKHLLMTFSGDLVLRTHMRMNGSWHIYRPNEPWQLGRHAMRIRIDTAEWVAVAFHVYVAEFITARDMPRHRAMATLGPDLLGTFDPARALQQIRRRDERPVHEVLLDQRVMAGIGNVYKSEVLFLSQLHPDTHADALTDDEWFGLMALARRLLQANVAERSAPGIETYRGPRRTTRRLNPEDRLWVYGRGGQPCRKCGTSIQRRKDGDSARVTYWCPRCQVMR